MTLKSKVVGFLQFAQGDNEKVYLERWLAQNWRVTDGLFDPVTGHNHNGSGTNGPTVSGGGGVTLNWRGAWSASTAYAKNDGVSHNGGSYIALSAVGPTSTTPDTDPAHWGVLAAPGGTGPQGPAGPAGATGATGPAGMTWRGAWQTAPTTYAAHDAVSYNGSSYIANTGNVASPPPSSSWDLLAAQGATGAVGATGATGPTGPTGATGAGVASGGTAGQVLAKIDATNYNTQWVTPASGITIPLTQNLTFSPDNTYDIGASSTTLRPRTLYTGTDVIVGRILGMNSTQPIRWNNDSAHQITDFPASNYMELKEWMGEVHFARADSGNYARIRGLSSGSNGDYSLDNPYGSLFLTDTSFLQRGANAYYDGTNWQRYSTANPSAMDYVGPAASGTAVFGIRWIASGSGAISWPSDVFQVLTAGAIVVPLGTNLQWGSMGSVSSQNRITIWTDNNFYADLNAGQQYQFRINGSPNLQITGGVTQVTGALLIQGTLVGTSAGQISFAADHVTSVGGAGSASPLPSAPAGYWQIHLAGTQYRIPYYN